MIFYNNRYRGPFEYDKFALNILSFHNIINELETLEIKGTKKEFNRLKEIKDNIDIFFEEYTKANGLRNKINLSILKEKENLKV